MLEWGGFVGRLRSTLANIDKWVAPEKLSDSDFPVSIVSEPKGVVLNILPWNWPLGQLGMTLCAMLAAGNCVMNKPSELSPTVAEYMQNLLSGIDGRYFLITRTITVLAISGIPAIRDFYLRKFLFHAILSRGVFSAARGIPN